MVLRMKYLNYEIYKDGIWWKAWTYIGHGTSAEVMRALTQKGLIKKLDKDALIF